MITLDFVKGNSVLIGLLLVIGYIAWKYYVQPRINEGNPIEPEENEEEGMFDNPFN